MNANVSVNMNRLPIQARLPGAPAKDSCPIVSIRGSTPLHLVLVTLALLALVFTGIGCQHMKNNEQSFFTGAEQGIEDARRYAASRLKNLSGADLQAIAGTRPGISHVDYSRVHYRWTNICTVLATAPPCRPYMVMDQR